MEDAVSRILLEMTGLKDLFMDQLAAFAGVKRHPEGRILTVAYYTIVKFEDVEDKVKPVTDYMRDARWFAIDEVPDLAFDHQKILEKSLDTMKQKIGYTPIAFELLPEKFTLTQLQQVYETILNVKLDKRNFRKKVATFPYLKELNEFQQ